MDIINLLESNSYTAIEKRRRIENAIKTKDITIKEIQSTKSVIDDKRMAIVLEAMEQVMQKNPELASVEWLKFVQEFILSNSNNLKRESSRIIGNIAQLFPNDLETAIQRLMINTEDLGTVIRWGSAYAFARIIIVPKFANSELYNTLSKLCEKEENNGVKNQLLNALKKAKKLRNNNG